MSQSVIVSAAVHRLCFRRYDFLSMYDNYDYVLLIKLSAINQNLLSIIEICFQNNYVFCLIFTKMRGFVESVFFFAKHMIQPTVDFGYMV